ncbi:MAG: long-chain fatty acid--CoA ligase [Desulfuromonas sp.]|nr:long-chain fatty acid--CoA ligase [Desulfuromonas sp.]PLX86271.1 MAG: long-chain fatty acid--CoA ligase [Desulfuromonas sp.]
MNETLPKMVSRQARRLSSQTALRYKEKGAYRDISWKAMEQAWRGYALGLLSLGLRPGERVAIMGPNGPAWVFADLAAMHCGAVSVPIYHTEGLEAILHVVNDSQSRFLFLFSPLLAEELLSHLAEVPQLERVILLEGSLEHPSFVSLQEFLAGGDQQQQASLDTLTEKGSAEDPATIIYTSGTTGPPKGVTLSHRNILANIEAAVKSFEISEKDTCLSFLPLSHVFERVDGYYLMLHQGAVIAYAENIDTVPLNLQEIAPTIVISVPRLFEKMFARIMERVLAGPWHKKQIFFTALKAGRAAVARRQGGRNPGVLLEMAVAAANALVFTKLKGHLGGQVRFFISGGAPLPRNVAEFFLAANLPIYEGYGLTETAAGITVNSPQAHRIGTVGRPFEGTDVRIADDGEIVVRGPGIFQGYWNAPERTAETFADGWFKTGDIGEFDPEGFLLITDRKKDIIVTAGGKNIAPQVIESLFKHDKFLSNAMVYGDRKPYLTALLVPNFDNL